MSLTQYLESQEDQDYSTSLELKRGGESVSVCLGMETRGDLYSCNGKNMNGMSYNEN